MQINKDKKFTEFFDALSAKQFRKIDFLVLHHVAANSADHAIEMFKECRVSAHFLVDEAGNIFELVDENDIAYHAGVSFWKGVDSLNKVSIGIEFINSKPFEKKFEKEQLIAGIQLCKYLIAKHKIAPANVVGHSDIAYDRTTNLLDRKQDPSHLFDWKFFGENGVGIFPQFNPEETKLFEFGNKDAAILAIKQNLKKFGYRVLNLNDEFDAEMQALATVFNRRFIGKDLNFWCVGANEVLLKI